MTANIYHDCVICGSHKLHSIHHQEAFCKKCGSKYSLTVSKTLSLICTLTKKGDGHVSKKKDNKKGRFK